MTVAVSKSMLSSDIFEKGAVKAARVMLRHSFLPDFLSSPVIPPRMNVGLTSVPLLTISLRPVLTGALPSMH